MSKVKLTKELKAQAAAVAAELKVSELYVNETGEFFTEHNRALLSVKNDKEAIEKLTFSKVEKPAAPAEDSKELKAAKGALAKAEKELEKANPDAKEAAEKAVAEAKQAVNKLQSEQE